MKIKRKGLTLNIFEDDIESPRTYYQDTNKTKMICFHRRYSLGDEHGFKNPTEFSEWAKQNESKIATIKPLYLLDHSGITISTHDFMDPWDSGQVGYVYVLKDDVKDYQKSVVDEIVEEEVKEYANWLSGDPQYFSFEITDEDDVRIECEGVFELTTEKEMFKEMKERSEHKFDFLFDALLQQENYL